MTSPLYIRLTVDDISQFIESVQLCSVPAQISCIINEHHVHFGLEKLVVPGAGLRRRLAELFMRVEGYGKLLTEANNYYWPNEGRYSKIVSRGMPIRQEWAKFQDCVGQKLETTAREIRNGLLRAAGITKEDAVRENLMEKAAVTESLAKSFGSVGFIDGVCRCALDFAVAVTDQTINDPERRRFPLISEEIEAMLLEVCSSHARRARIGNSRLNFSMLIARGVGRMDLRNDFHRRRRFAGTYINSRINLRDASLAMVLVLL